MLLSKKVVGLVVLISVPSMFWQARASASAADHYNRLPNVVLKAQRAVEKGHPERALDLLAGRIDSLPFPAGQAHAHALICQAHYQKQDYLSAEKSCDVAANTGRPSWSHLNNRGVMRFMLGRYDEALTDFRQAASIMVSASKEQSRSIRSNVSAATRRLASR